MKNSSFKVLKSIKPNLFLTLNSLPDTIPTKSQTKYIFHVSSWLVRLSCRFYAVGQNGARITWSGHYCEWRVRVTSQILLIPLLFGLKVVFDSTRFFWIYVLSEFVFDLAQLSYALSENKSYQHKLINFYLILTKTNNKTKSGLIYFNSSSN